MNQPHRSFFSSSIIPTRHKKRTPPTEVRGVEC
nr:MAG TPA: hypothetical protein [Caudoviricetes sp.]